MSAADPDRVGPADGHGYERTIWAIAALLTIACLLYVMQQQLGPLRHQVLQDDELFFGACASRAQVDGWASVAGCHDNKAPLIYLLHAALQGVSHPFDAPVLKATSIAMLALLAALVGCVAARLAPRQPRMAAIAAVAMLLCALAPSPSLLAVKTEFLGMLFVMLSLVVLSGGARPASPGRALAAGVAMGLALMSKQSFALLLPALAWGLWRGSAPLPPAARGLRLLMAACGVVLPALALGLMFAAQGRLDEFLSTTFLYPAIYGNPEPASLGKRLFWKTVTAGEFLMLTPIHVLLVTAALLAVRAQPRPAVLQTVLLQLCLLALGILLASPALFKYHAIPFWVLSAPLAGGLLATAASASATRQLACATLLAATLLAFAQTTVHNNGKQRTGVAVESLDPARGRFLYVLGMEPGYYARGFIPASSVQFPWALAGTPETWAYRHPRPESSVQRWLAAQQQRNLQQLYADFARTPPAYIVVIDLYARSAASKRTTDVPGFDDYLARHCERIGPAADTRGNPGHLFACATGG